MNYKIQKIINKITFGLTEMGPGFNFKDIWYNFKHGFKNLYRFFWVIWKWRPWDFIFNLNLLSRGLSQYLKLSQNSILTEIDRTRLPKEKNMKRVIEIINNINKSNYIEKAENILGEIITHNMMNFKEIKDKPGFSEMIDERSIKDKEHTKKVFKLSENIEENEWNELIKILKKDARSWWN